MVAGHLRLKNGYWHMVLSYNDEMGKRVTKSVTTHLKEKGNKKRAEGMLLELRRQATEKQQVQRRAAGIYFDAYLESWLDGMRLTVSPTTFRTYSTIVRGSICPYFKPLNVLISEVEPRHIAEYYDSLLLRGSSPATVRRHHANIHKALKRAVMDGLIPGNPADRVEPPKQEKYTAAYYNAEECRALLDAVKGSELELPIALALFFGLRRCEVLGLKWEAVDFAQHVLHIRHAVHQVQGEVIERDTLKRKSSFRTLPLPREIERLLQGRQKGDGFICLDADGQLLTPNALSAKFKQTLKKHGLKEIRFHDLRHTCAALLIGAGVPLVDVSHWLGHSTIAITADLYGHLEFTSKLQCASVLSGVLVKNERRFYGKL